MSILTKDQILAANDSITEEVDVSQWWKGSVLLKSLSGHERDNFEQKCVDRSKGKDKMDLRGLKVALLALVIVDEKGNRLFSEKDIVAFNNKAAAPINKLFEKAQEMNGLRQEDLDTLEKN